MDTLDECLAQALHFSNYAKSLITLIIVVVEELSSNLAVRLRLRSLVLLPTGEAVLLKPIGMESEGVEGTVA